MHRRIEIGLGMLLALVVANGGQAGPRDGRFGAKNHSAGAAPARTYAEIEGDAAPVNRGYRYPAPADAHGAARGWGYAGPVYAHAAQRAYGAAAGRGYAGAPPYGVSAGPGVGSATWRANGYAGAHPYAAGPNGWAAPGRAFGYTGPPPYGATPGSAYGGGWWDYGYAGEPGNGYLAVPKAGYLAGQTFAAPVLGDAAKPRCCAAAVPVYGYVTDPGYNSPYPPDPIFGYYPVLYPW
ncbi:MAG TPA: hypothetical protein VFR19_17180 [Hyphomicrobiaceae bacterium]|jgi:hypothetical protein|nr:hypothetical protein [Hyphomicrobiaceae bacterium]